MDENGDGKISKREIARGYRMAGFNPTREEVEEIVKQHDVNCTFGNSKIWLVLLGFNATLTAKVISWRSLTRMCFLAF